MAETLRFLFIGDIIGQPGMAVFQRWIGKIKEKYAIDAIIVNGENAAKNGKGITPPIIDFFKQHGVSVITTGNHAFEHREVYTALSERDDIIRPAATGHRSGEGAHHPSRGALQYQLRRAGVDGGTAVGGWMDASKGVSGAAPQHHHARRRGVSTAVSA